MGGDVVGQASQPSSRGRNEYITGLPSLHDTGGSPVGGLLPKVAIKEPGRGLEPQ